MSFKDQNGKITIDEEEAGKDINRLTLAGGHLNEALSEIRQIVAVSSEFKGGYCEALLGCAEKYEKAISALIQECTDTSEMIRKIVAKYQQIDIELKNVILSRKDIEN